GPREAGSLSALMRAPQAFLVHDVDFHRTLAASSGNPILAALIEMVSALYYERRRKNARRAANRDLHAAAHAHPRAPRTAPSQPPPTRPAASIRRFASTMPTAPGAR